MTRNTSDPAPAMAYPTTAVEPDIASELPAIGEPLWLIVNPQAGRKAGITTNAIEPEEAQRILERHGVRVTARMTERQGHATELAREAAAAGARTVVAAGGDGTVREVAIGLIDTDVTLGILPLGSMMNVARSLNIPRDLAGAAEIIRHQRTIRMDVGWAKTASKESYFIEAAGVGVDAGIFAYASELDEGRWASIVRLLRYIRRFRPRRIHLRIDDRDVDVRACYSITVAIGPYTGAALTLAPDAKVDDRQFDVVVREGFGRAEFLMHLINNAWGRRKRHHKARTLRGHRVEIADVGHHLWVHADGEMIGITPAGFNLHPAAIKVFAGLPEPGEPSAVRTLPAATPE
jgi:diacylglycerol kinase (ATP)